MGTFLEESNRQGPYHFAWGQTKIWLGCRSAMAPLMEGRNVFVGLLRGDEGVLDSIISRLKWSGGVGAKRCRPHPATFAASCTPCKAHNLLTFYL